ncbi:MAG TPA: hypothetical protein VGG64_18540 [Pirellulales bacterium]
MRPFRCSRREGIARVAALIVVLAGAQPGFAQTDSTAAREGRAALREVRQTYLVQGTSATWARRLSLDDVAAELRAGTRADPKVLKGFIGELRRTDVPQYREKAFQRLSAALTARTKELADIPVDEWQSHCAEIAKNSPPATPAVIDAHRKLLAERLDSFERRLPELRQSTNRWSKFLFWPETRQLATSNVSDPDVLDRLERRWQNALSVWQSDELLEVSMAVQTYVPLLRSYLWPETAEERAAAWDQIAALLDPSALAEKAGPAALGQAIHNRERIGQAPQLTASIRRHFSHPNVVLQVRPSWLQAKLSQPINEPYRVNDVFAGARTVGSGRLVGKATFEVLPSQVVGRWVMRLDATSTARTTGYSDRVRVQSRANTSIRGEKQFVLDEVGLTSRRATADASTRIVYDGIDAEGLAPRRNEATRQTQARRPRAETDSSALAERTTIGQLDTEGQKLAASFNASYRKDYRDPLILANRLVPATRVRASRESVRWECDWISPTGFARTPASPQLADAAVAIGLASTALEEEATSSLAGRRLSGDELVKAVGGMLGASDAPGQTTQDFAVTFANPPCEVQIANGVVHVRLQITSFQAAEVEYPAMSVDVDYTPSERDGGLTLTRQGGLRVKFLAAEGEQPKAVSGRQQTLKLAVQRRLGRVLTEELRWPAIVLPDWIDRGAKLRVDAVSADAGWLQMALKPDPS